MNFLDDVGAEDRKCDRLNAALDATTLVERSSGDERKGSSVASTPGLAYCLKTERRQAQSLSAFLHADLRRRSRIFSLCAVELFIAGRAATAVSAEVNAERRSPPGFRFAPQSSSASRFTAGATGS